MKLLYRKTLYRHLIAEAGPASERMTAAGIPCEAVVATGTKARSRHLVASLPSGSTSIIALYPIPKRDICLPSLKI